MNVDKLYFAITLFICLYMIVIILKPSFIYNHQQNCCHNRNHSQLKHSNMTHRH